MGKAVDLLDIREQRGDSEKTANSRVLQHFLIFPMKVYNISCPLVCEPAENHSGCCLRK
jgi:hypothetical protein